jgi:hypothetical protein
MSYIFSLTIDCVAGPYLKEPYKFVLEIPDDAWLGDLEAWILDVVGFDDEHLSDFYIASSVYGKRTTITSDPESAEDHGGQTILCLSELFPLPKNKKLYYLYDYGRSWYFQISKMRKSGTRLAGQEYPRLVSETGIKPLQYGEDEDEEDDAWEDVDN